MRFRPHWLILNSRLPRLLGHGAVTVALWTFVALPTCSAELRAHENRHVQQYVWCFSASAALLTAVIVLGGFRWPMLATPFTAFWAAYWAEYAVRIGRELARGNWRTTFKTAYKRLSWEKDAYYWAALHKRRFTSL